MVSMVAEAQKQNMAPMYSPVVK